jgi:hypothetical protein
MTGEMGFAKREAQTSLRVGWVWKKGKLIMKR